MNNTKKRLFDPKLGGGSLLDLGIYPISFASLIFKEEPKNISATGKISSQGVDLYNSVMLTYSNGKNALLSSSFLGFLNNEAVIYGEKGYIKIPHFHYASRVSIFSQNDDKKPNINQNQRILWEEKEYDYSYPPPGYQFEIREVHRCLDKNLLESQIMPLDESYKIMKILDKMRKQIGEVFPGDLRIN